MPLHGIPHTAPRAQHPHNHQIPPPDLLWESQSDTTKSQSRRTLPMGTTPQPVQSRGPDCAPPPGSPQPTSGSGSGMGIAGSKRGPGSTSSSCAFLQGRTGCEEGAGQTQTPALPPHPNPSTQGPGPPRDPTPEQSPAPGCRAEPHRILGNHPQACTHEEQRMLGNYIQNKQAIGPQPPRKQSSLGTGLLGGT